MKYSNFNMLDRTMLVSKLNITSHVVYRGIFLYERVFASTVVEGKTILEIGAGRGLLSCMLSLAGARSVTALEPEAQGAGQEVLEKFRQNIKACLLNNVEPIKKTLQEYQLPINFYDIAVSIDSVNHWDEEACINLHRNENSQKTYIEMFQKILRSLTDNGRLLIQDLGKLNLFSWGSNHLGIPNPFCPTIEWYKHQQPRLWAQLLREAGFSQVKWKWVFPTTICKQGRILLDNPLFNNAILTYLTTSKFVIWATK